MSELIHFRTYKKSSHTGESSIERIRARGSEYEWLREAHPYDDARDIAWKQSLKTEHIYVKSRESTTDISVVLIGVSDESWDFSLWENDDKHSFYATLLRLCESSTRQSHMSYLWLPSAWVDESTLDTMVQNTIRNTLIIIVISSLDVRDYSRLGVLSAHNDLLVIHLFHPYEISPDSYPDTLMQSTLIDSKKYHILFDEKQDEVQKWLTNNTIGYIRMTTNDNPVERLNHYFKHFYAR
jgi:hypothetical protein